MSKGAVAIAINGGRLDVKFNVVELNKMQLKAVIAELEMIKINLANKFWGMKE